MNFSDSQFTLEPHSAYTDHVYSFHLERVEYLGCDSLEEFQFIGRPEKLMDLIDRCDDEGRLFWTSRDACFGKRKTTDSDMISRGYYCISLILKNADRRQSFEMYGKTATDAVGCLDFLLSLPEDDDESSYDEVTIIPKGKGRYNFKPTKCPIGVRSLAMLLTGCINKRQYKFQRTIFSASQARTMAVTGTETSICFRLCQFEGEGEAFVEAFHNNHMPSKQGPAHLTFDGYPRNPPFGREHWLRFLQSHRLSEVRLNLRFFCFDREVGDTLASASLKGLFLTDCTFADEGEALVQSLEMRQGARELHLEVDTFRSLDRWKDFMVAVGRDECHLQRLSIIDGNIFTGGFATTLMEYLSDGLRTNRSLVELSCVTQSCMDSFARLCDAVATHPTLLSVDLKPDTTCEPQQKKDYANLIASAVERNQHLECIRFHQDFDQVIWDTRINQRLIHNRYWKLFRKYQSYDLKEPTFAAALGSVSSTPSLIWMLLCDHSEIVANGFGQ
jgi:hypothetical protein